MKKDILQSSIGTCSPTPSEKENPTFFKVPISVETGVKTVQAALVFVHRGGFREGWAGFGGTLKDNVYKGSLGTLENVELYQVLNIHQ